MEEEDTTPSDKVLQAYYQLNQYALHKSGENLTPKGLMISGLPTNESEVTALSSVDEEEVKGNVNLENDVNTINMSNGHSGKSVQFSFGSLSSSHTTQRPNKVDLAHVLSSEADAVAKQQLRSREDTLSVELSRMLKSGGSFLCDNCSEQNAEFYCLQCPADCSKYCRLCAKSHRSLKIFRSHTVQPISGVIPSPKPHQSPPSVSAFHYISPRNEEELMGPLEDAEIAEAEKMNAKEEEKLAQTGQTNKFFKDENYLSKEGREGRETMVIDGIIGNITGEDILDDTHEEGTGREVKDWLEEVALAANTKNSENLKMEAKLASDNEARVRKEYQLSEVERIAIEHEELEKAEIEINERRIKEAQEDTERQEGGNEQSRDDTDQFEEGHLPYEQTNLMYSNVSSQYTDELMMDAKADENMIPEIHDNYGEIEEHQRTMDNDHVYNQEQSGFISTYLGYNRVFTGGWVEFHHDGEAYYYNEHTHESTWELPSDCTEIVPDYNNHLYGEYLDNEHHQQFYESTQAQEDTDYSSAENWDSSVEVEDLNHASRINSESNNIDIMMLALGSGGETTADEASVVDGGHFLAEEDAVIPVNNYTDNRASMNVSGFPEHSDKVNVPIAEAPSIDVHVSAISENIATDSILADSTNFAAGPANDARKEKKSPELFCNETEVETTETQIKFNVGDKVEGNFKGKVRFADNRASTNVSGFPEHSDKVNVPIAEAPSIDVHVSAISENIATDSILADSTNFAAGPANDARKEKKSPELFCNETEVETTETQIKFNVGDKVEGNFKGKGRWFPGEILKVNEDGTYNVEYNDGDWERNVDAADLVLLDAQMRKEKMESKRRTVAFVPEVIDEAAHAAENVDHKLENIFGAREVPSVLVDEINENARNLLASERMSEEIRQLRSPQSNQHMQNSNVANQKFSANDTIDLQTDGFLQDDDMSEVSDFDDDLVGYNDLNNSGYIGEIGQDVDQKHRVGVMGELLSISSDDSSTPNMQSREKIAIENASKNQMMLHEMVDVQLFEEQQKELLDYLENGDLGDGVNRSLSSSSKIKFSEEDQIMEYDTSTSVFAEPPKLMPRKVEKTAREREIEAMKAFSEGITLNTNDEAMMSQHIQVQPYPPLEYDSLSTGMVGEDYTVDEYIKNNVDITDRTRGGIPLVSLTGASEDESGKDLIHSPDPLSKHHRRNYVQSPIQIARGAHYALTHDAEGNRLSKSEMKSNLLEDEKKTSNVRGSTFSKTKGASKLKPRGTKFVSIGIVCVTLVSAVDLHNTDEDAGGVADPYAKLTVGATTHISKKHKNTLNPIFNEEFRFRWNGQDPLLVEIRNLGPGTSREDDHFLGEAIVSLHNYDFTDGISGFRPLKVRNRTLMKTASGKISLFVSYTPKSGYIYMPPERPNKVETISKRFGMLAQSTADRFRVAPKPPKHSDKLYPPLPCDDIFINQSHESKECKEFQIIPSTCDRIRICIDAEAKENTVNYVRATHNILSYERSDFYVEEDCSKDPEQMSLLTKQPSRVVKKKDALEGLFPPFYRDYEKYAKERNKNNSYKGVAEKNTHRFASMFQLGFYCLVLDDQMQIIGTFDNALKKFCKGLTFHPPYLREKVRESLYPRSMEERYGGNLLEINFAELPPETFVIVPILYDESIIQGNMENDPLYSRLIQFKLDVFQRQSVQLKHLSPNLVFESENIADGVNNAYIVGDVKILKSTGKIIIEDTELTTYNQENEEKKQLRKDAYNKIRNTLSRIFINTAIVIKDNRARWTPEMKMKWVFDQWKTMEVRVVADTYNTDKVQIVFSSHEIQQRKLRHDEAKISWLAYGYTKWCEYKEESYILPEKCEEIKILDKGRCGERTIISYANQRTINKKMAEGEILLKKRLREFRDDEKNTSRTTEITHYDDPYKIKLHSFDEGNDKNCSVDSSKTHVVVSKSYDVGSRNSLVADSTVPEYDEIKHLNNKVCYTQHDVLKRLIARGEVVTECRSINLNENIALTKEKNYATLKKLQILTRRASFKYFDLNDKVEVQYKKFSDKFMKGKIIRDRGDDTYDVMYDNDDAVIETCVPASNIRSLMNKFDEEGTEGDDSIDDDDESMDDSASRTLQKGANSSKKERKEPVQCWFRGISCKFARVTPGEKDLFWKERSCTGIDPKGQISELKQGVNSLQAMCDASVDHQMGPAATCDGISKVNEMASKLEATHNTLESCQSVITKNESFVPFVFFKTFSTRIGTYAIDQRVKLNVVTVDDTDDWQNGKVIRKHGDDTFDVMLDDNSREIITRVPKCRLRKESGATAEDGVQWAMKRVSTSVDDPYTSNAFFERIVGIVAAAHAVPYHIIHVEHCHNCEKHQNTTRHLPGYYENKFHHLIAYLKTRMPMCLFYNNLPQITSHPRLGSFEVSMRKYGGKKTQLLYSKLSKNRFPNEADLVAQINTIVTPETLVFPSNCPLEIQLYDSYTRSPVFDADVRIVKVNVSITANHIDAVESVLVSKNPNVTFLPEGVVPFKTIPTSTCAPKNTNDVKTQGASRYKKFNANTTSNLVNSADIEDVRLRQSSAFSRVCAWGKGQVERWLREYGASDHSIQLAAMDGLVDGACLLKILTPAKLQEWGIVNRKVINAILEAFSDLKKDEEEAEIEISKKQALAGASRALIKHESSVEKNKNDGNSSFISYTTVWTGRSKANGICVADLSASGSYFIEVNSAIHVPYRSHVISVSENKGNICYCASLKPRVGEVIMQVNLEAEKTWEAVKLDFFSEASVLKVASENLLLSLVNLKTGRRHIIQAEYFKRDSVCNFEDIQHERAMADRQSVIRRMSSASNMPAVIDPRKAQVSNMPLVNYTHACGGLYLPLGAYYSEVDGSIVRITSDDPSQGSVVLECDLKLAMKCHSRIVKNSLKLFHQLRKKFQHNYGERSIRVKAFLVSKMLKIIPRIRENIINKKVIRIQRAFRRFKFRLFSELWEYGDLPKNYMQLHWKQFYYRYEIDQRVLVSVSGEDGTEEWHQNGDEIEVWRAGKIIRENENSTYDIEFDINNDTAVQVATHRIRKEPMLKNKASPEVKEATKLKSKTNAKNEGYIGGETSYSSQLNLTTLGKLWKRWYEKQNTTITYSYDREHNYQDEYENWYDLKCTMMSPKEKVVWELIDHEWEEIERTEYPIEYHKAKQHTAEKKWEVLGMKGGIRKDKSRSRHRLRIDAGSRHEIILKQRVNIDGSLGEVVEVPIYDIFRPRKSRQLFKHLELWMVEQAVHTIKRFYISRKMHNWAHLWKVGNALKKILRAVQIRQAKRRGQRFRKAYAIIINFLIVTSRRWRRRRNDCAQLIQSYWRMYKAIMTTASLRKQRHAMKKMSTVKGYLSNKAANRKLLDHEFRVSRVTIQEMMREEALMRQLMKEERDSIERTREYQNRKHRQKLEMMERERLKIKEKYRKDVIRLQKNIRMLCAAHRFHKFIRGMRKFQFIMRIRIRCRIRERFKERALLMRKKKLSAEAKPVSKSIIHFLKNVKEVFTGPPENTTTSSILSAILHKHAVTVQAAFRMYKHRRAYIAKRVALGMSVTKLQRYQIDLHKSRQKDKKIPKKPEEVLQPLNPLHMLKGLRKLLKARRSRTETTACITIQALSRGFLVRNRLYNAMNQHLHDTLPETEYVMDKEGDADSSGPLERFRPGGSIATNMQAIEDMKTNVHQRRKEQFPESPMTATGKRILKGMKFASQYAEQRLGEAGQSMTTTMMKSAQEIASQTKEFVHRQKKHHELMKRREKGMVSIEDALMRIECKTTTAKDISEVNRQCYFVIYPSSVNQANSNPAYFHEIGSDYHINPTKSVKVNARMYQEVVRSLPFNTFGSAAFKTLDVMMHLSDLSRYEKLEIILYMHHKKGTPLPSDEIPTPPSFSQLRGGFTMKNDGQKDFVAAFMGTCTLDRGKAFGPAGGRRTVLLKPVELELEGTSIAKQVMACRGIELMCTLMPVAFPTSAYLSQFKRPKTAFAQFPCSLVDGTQVEAGLARCNVFNGSAVSMNYFNINGSPVEGSLIVSARSKTSATNLFEFDNEGNYIQSIDPEGTYIEELGTTLLILCGNRHIACCGNKGNILFLREKPHESMQEKPKRTVWDKPLMMPTHYSAIHSGCCVCHAGVDIFFSADRAGNIAVSFLHDLVVVGSCYNTAMSSVDLVEMQCSGSILYLLLVDGTITAIDISSILGGSVGSASELKHYVIFESEVFHWNAGIHSSAIAHSAAYYGLPDLDKALRTKEHSNKNLEVSPPENVSHEEIADVLSGHILLVGGGDRDPRVVLLRYHHETKQLIQFGMLNGHANAVTQIRVDAAERFIFTASQNERVILLWDALTYRCERKFDDVNIDSMVLGYNCMYVSSFKAPFLRVWHVPREEKQQKKSKHKRGEKEEEEIVLVHNSREADAQAIKWRRSDLRYEDRYLEKVYEAYIGCIRNLRYCHSLLKPTDFQITQGIGQPPYFEDGVVEIVSRWKQMYDLYTDYPVRKPIDEEVKASVIIRPPTPARVSFPEIDTRQNLPESGGEHCNQDVVFTTTHEEKRSPTQYCKKYDSDEDDNSYLAPRRTRHHFSSDDDSDTEEEEENEMNELQITPHKLARESWRKGKIRHPDTKQNSRESESPSNSSQEFRGQGFVIPRPNRRGTKTRRATKKELEKAAQDQVRVAKEIAARQAKFHIRGVRNLMDTDSSDDGYE